MCHGLVAKFNCFVRTLGILGFFLCVYIHRHTELHNFKNCIVIAIILLGLFSCMSGFTCEILMMLTIGKEKSEKQ